MLVQYGMMILHSVVLLIMSYVSLCIKNIYQRYHLDRVKKEVVKMVCCGITQFYPNVCGSQKLNLIIDNCQQILKEKGILISDLELRMYISYHLGSDNV